VECIRTHVLARAKTFRAPVASESKGVSAAMHSLILAGVLALPFVIVWLVVALLTITIGNQTRQR